MIPYDTPSIEAISDTNNYIGIINGATDDYDVDFDIPEPPSNPGNWISLYFPHSDWDLAYENFTQDIRSNILDENQLIEWDFNVASNSYGTIQFDFEILDEYCYNCIEYIQLSNSDEVYNIEQSDIHTFSFSPYMPAGLPPSEMILSFNLIIGFLDSNE